jgi:hypothetical protein
VAPVAGIALFAAVNIEPFVFRRIKGDIASLEPPAGCGDEELAQRVVADDPDRLIDLAFAAKAASEDFREPVGIEKYLRAVLPVDEGLLGKKRLIIHVGSHFTFRHSVVGFPPICGSAASIGPADYKTR